MGPTPLTNEKPTSANLLSKEDKEANVAVDSKEIQDTPSETPLILFCRIHKKPYSVLGYQILENHVEEPIYDCIDCVTETFYPPEELFSRENVE